MLSHPESRAAIVSPKQLANANGHVKAIPISTFPSKEVITAKSEGRIIYRPAISSRSVEEHF